MKPFKVFFAAAGACIFATVALPGIAATTTTVTTTSDGVSGSLRERLQNSAPGNTILFAVTGTIVLTNELPITKDINIFGPGSATLAISGNGARRIFNVSSGVSVNISDLTLRDGYTVGTNGTTFNFPNQGQGSRGGDGFGAGVLNQGTLTLSNCIISGCRSQGGVGGYDTNMTYEGGAAFGGAINNLGTLTLIGCLLANNSAAGGLGGLALAVSPTNSGIFTGGLGGLAGGGGLANSGTATLWNCTLQQNRADGGESNDSHGAGLPGNPVRGRPGGKASGGAIWNRSGTLGIVNCTINGNSTTGGNGGRADGDRATASWGGDSSGGAIENRSTLRMTNCTLSGNAARGGLGGDTYGRADFPGSGGSAQGGAVAAFASFQISACTVASNFVAEGIGGDGGSGNSGSTQGGGIFHQTGVASLGSTIVAGNAPADAEGVFTSQGNNLIGITDDSSGWVGSDLQGDSFIPLDPLLSALRDNGGTTFTMALASSSPALDRGDDSLLGLLSTDQRGSPRKTGAHLDIGAYEAGSCAVVNNNDSGPGSLRQAVLVAQATDTILFASNVVGTITLTSGQITISGNRTILGPLAGVTISGNNFSRVFNISGGATASIANLTISNGRFKAGSGIAMGGGVLNQGTLTLANCTVSANAVIGFDGSGGTVGNPGGIAVGGGVANLGTLNLLTCTLANNSATGGRGGNGTTFRGSGGHGGAGGVYNEQTLVIRSCTISANSASGGSPGSGPSSPTIAVGKGGGLYQTNASGISTSMRNTIVSGNSVSGTAGATGPDVDGPVGSQGYNLIGNTSGSSGWTGTDIQGSNPLLGPLQNNGGATLTMELLAGSPAIDQGSSGGFNSDQRGLLRPTDFSTIPNSIGGDGADIGAFEVQIPRIDIGLRAHDGNTIIRIAVDASGTLGSPVRITKNGATYGVALTDPNSPEASRFRIQTPSGTKALVKLP